MSPLDWLRVLICLTLANAEKVFLLDTLNATAELGWKVNSNQQNGDEWQEETYRADTANLNHQAFATCMVEHPNLENWLYLPHVSMGEASRIYFEVKFTMRKCQEIPTAQTTCKETLKVYAFGSSKSDLDSSANWYSGRKWDFVDILSINDDKNQVFVQTLSFTTAQPGVYFAIKDEGACSSILYIKIYYEVCSATTTFLTHFPRTIPGDEVNSVKKVTGKCSQNATVPASNFKSPISLCKSDGTWQTLTSECECVAGFIPSKNTNTCAPCGIGSYKQTAGDGLSCTPCPRNSFANKLGSVGCECELNFYRPFGTQIDAPCIPVETSTNQTSISSNVVSNNGQNPVSKTNDPSTLQVSREVVLVLGTIIVFVLICGFMIVVFVHQRNLPKNKHQSDLDVLEHYKQGSMTPDYSHTIVNGTFPAFHQGDYARKMNMPLIPASYGTARYGMTNRFRPYVDPTTYEDPQEALAEFANEISPENVEVTRTIGVGEFGEVCSGRLRVENLYGGVVQQIVAVKTLLPGSSIKAKSDFLTEASIMGQFDHPNVVHLVGVVTKSEPVMILTEYMLNGSLDKFLQTNDNGRLCAIQLIQMMSDTANGMKYLCDKGYVHRDLAARNILVDDRLTCKISDFGLSRGVSSTTDHEYTTQGGKIPIRWTAPEAISHRKYSSASDVWSFGVLQWEILSFGERPYWEWSNHKVIESVQNGFRLPKPMDAPDCLYTIMLQCWQTDRHLRPTFDQLCHQLNTILVHFTNQMEVSNQPCNELNVALPPLSDPPMISLAAFLRLNGLEQCIPTMEQNNIKTIDELRRLNCRELVAMGLVETDARQILMHLARPQKFNYDGITDSFDSFCAQRNETMNRLFNESQQHPSTLQHSMSRPPKRSPLLSASSIATNQTAVTNNSNASSLKGDRARRNTLDEEGFFV